MRTPNPKTQVANGDDRNLIRYISPKYNYPKVTDKVADYFIQLAVSLITIELITGMETEQNYLN